MAKFWETLYKIWVWTCFVVVFILLYPFFVLFVQKESWKKYGHFMNRIWAHTVFYTCFLRTKIDWEFKPDSKQQYIYCANHTSFLDIPTICYALPGYNVFIGKAALAKVPVFGYMFRNLYIPVDRKSAKSRYNTMIQSLEKLNLGHNLAIFPEGTIPPHAQAPKMIPFKDGAFRMAIEKQIPIVPMSIINNWQILPDDGKFVPRRKLMHAVVHAPISTKGLTLDDVDTLKDQTYAIIESTLKKYHSDKF
ncbi:MAG: lysophospholipid acyltransferase family protein [Cytophagaceae bacterium]